MYRTAMFRTKTYSNFCMIFLWACLIIGTLTMVGITLFTDELGEDDKWIRKLFKNILKLLNITKKRFKAFKPDLNHIFNILTFISFIDHPWCIFILGISYFATYR